MPIKSFNSLHGTAFSLPEMVYRTLRDAILNGTLAPGQMLRQEEVAVRLGVSRSPLREALPRLEAEGIVTLHPRRGYAVATIDPKEIGEAFDLRILLETELGRRSISMRTDHDVAQAYRIISEMTDLINNAEQSDRSKWFELNGVFHHTLLAPADCPHHMRVLQASRGTIEIYVRAEVRLTGDLEHAQHEHFLLAQAFENGDADRFLSLIKSHSIHTRDRLLAGLKKSAEARLVETAVNGSQTA
ncbi:GntR family transcriptional regulator [Alcaligenaceae bacterium]|nr:GntR family transcriptional regulator [Alcaligenaceae bacterium]